MISLVSFVNSTIGRKFLMALSGFVLAGFVLVHMLGNLSFLMGPEAINSYAHHLQSLPLPIMWGFRGILLLSVAVHVAMAVLLSMENRKARPEAYKVKKNVQASYASRTMMLSGIILLAFIVFHIAHFTLKVTPEPYTPPGYMLADGHVVPDVYRMMVRGFQVVWISVFYVVGTGLLCLHLSHGVASMLQTLGLRNETWRYRLNALAGIYGLVVFLGFAALPLSVALGWKM